MSWLTRVIAALALNLLAVLAADYLLPGVALTGSFADWLWVAAILTLLNFVVKPVLKLILGPIIILTLGLGLILVNMLVLYLLDISSAHFTIGGTLDLFYAALIVGAGNVIFHSLIKKS